MVLGVYWYYDFPYNLYSYEFFAYRKGLGGHGDAPAELEVAIEAKNADRIIQALRELVNQYSDAFVFIYKSGTYLQIGTGGYSMHDYDFEIALKVEGILKNHDAQKVNPISLKDAELIRLFNEKNTMVLPSKKCFGLVSSSPMKYNAQTSSIRFDCNVEASEKERFLKAVLVAAEAANIHVVFYKEKKCAERFNLMVFFTNGRQGVGLNPKQKVNTTLFENGMEELIQKHAVEIGLIGGFSEDYPSGDSTVLKIVDEEFIISK